MAQVVRTRIVDVISWRNAVMIATVLTFGVYESAEAHVENRCISFLYALMDAGKNFAKENLNQNEWFERHLTNWRLITHADIVELAEINVHLSEARLTDLKAEEDFVTCVLE